MWEYITIALAFPGGGICCGFWISHSGRHITGKVSHKRTYVPGV